MSKLILRKTGIDVLEAQLHTTVALSLLLE